MKQFVRYNPRLKEVARELRRNSTLAEVLLWRELKGKQMMGYDFHRQKPIDEYIVDFVCPALMLAIEIDGDSHMFKEEKDEKRQKRLEELGVRFLRFEDLDVKFRMDEVLKTIREWIQHHEDNKIHA
jgi:very-short-patch-repair endonuclease